MVGPRVKTYLSYIGANVLSLRARGDVTQEDLAEASGLDVRFLRRVERGSVNLRFDTIVRLAEALGVEPSALLRPAKARTPKPGRPRRPRTGRSASARSPAARTR